MRGTGEIEGNIVSDGSDRTSGRWCIAAAADKPWNTIGNDGTDGGEITMLDGFERRLLAATQRGINQ